MKTALILVVVATSACVVDSTETGPVLTIVMRGPLNSASPKDSDPHLTLGSRAEYACELEVEVEAGKELIGMDETTFIPAGFAITLAPLDLRFTEADFDPRVVLDDRRYDQKMTFMIPKASMGTTLTIHGEATDSRGIHSNIVEFPVALR